MSAVVLALALFSSSVAAMTPTLRGLEGVMDFNIATQGEIVGEYCPPWLIPGCIFVDGVNRCNGIPRFYDVNCFVNNASDICFGNDFDLSNECVSSCHVVVPCATERPARALAGDRSSA